MRVMEPLHAAEGQAHLEQQLAQQLDGRLADAPVLRKHALLHGGQQELQGGARIVIHQNAACAKNEGRAETNTVK